METCFLQVFQNRIRKCEKILGVSQLANFAYEHMIHFLGLPVVFSLGNLKRNNLKTTRSILDLKESLNSSTSKIFSAGNSLAVTSRTLEPIFCNLYQNLCFLKVVCFEIIYQFINCQYFTLIGTHWGTTGLKINYLLYFNNFSAARPTLDLNMSLDTAC